MLKINKNFTGSECGTQEIKFSLYSYVIEGTINSYILAGHKQFICDERHFVEIISKLKVPIEETIGSKSVILE